jgi:hypothetical protein
VVKERIGGNIGRVLLAINIMKVTIDRYRVLHLIILMTCSCILAETLISKFAWARLSAYGIACTVVTGSSNGIRSIIEKHDNECQNDIRRVREEKMEKRRDRRKR